jgi:hypothetical protein
MTGSMIANSQSGHNGWPGLVLSIAKAVISRIWSAQYRSTSRCPFRHFHTIGNFGLGTLQS